MLAVGSTMKEFRMRSWCSAIILVVLAPSAGLGQTSSAVERRIAAAERRIAANPRSHDGYNDLALGLAQRARDTADPAFYERAEEAVRRSLELDPGNLEGKKMRVWVLLGKHQFAAALELARSLNKEIPDDVQVYGFLTDALVELGNYKEAEEACQWMLDLRPGNVPALTRASYLRELFGDIEGSIELMSVAYQRTPPDEKEDRVWLLTQLGHLESTAGRFENAERLLHEALQVIPDYHYALANLAKLRTAQNRHDEAARLLKQRYDNAPHPENLYDFAEALERAERPTEARTAFAEFEKCALKEAESWDNANRELIFYYAKHAGKPEEALRIAKMESARRQDVYTLDAYAWALYANSEHREAREQVSRVLAVGTKDPALVERARIISAQSRD
jgi:tetratricopeptide (TPR) repeat protein